MPKCNKNLEVCRFRCRDSMLDAEFEASELNFEVKRISCRNVVTLISRRNVVKLISRRNVVTLMARRNSAKLNLLPKEPIESFWDALWLGIRPFLCLDVGMS